MHIKNLDLNLLIVLDSLLEHRNVSRAARDLGLSQPAVSHALARLRAALKDPLLVRRPGGMAPTPRAEGVKPHLRAWLTGMETLLTNPAPFDPSRSEVLFRIASNDYAGLTLLPGLCEKVTAAAPGVRLEILSQKEMVPYQALASATIDLAFSIRSEDRPGLYEKRLFHESFVCLVRNGHPAIQKRLTLKHYLEFDHLLVSPFGGMSGAVDEALKKIGLKRRVRIAVPQFALAPWMLAKTDLILTLPSRIAQTVGGEFLTFPPPVELEGFPFYALWNERTHSDPAHRWLREQLLTRG